MSSFQYHKSSLTEDLDNMKKYYPNISEDEFMTFVKLDPTYKGGNNPGTYTRWILGLADKNKLDNIGHVKDILTRFEDNKKYLKNKDIMKFKSIEDLENFLNDDDSYITLSHRQEVRQRQQGRKNVDLTKDADLVYEDSDWEVWVPKTYEASCKLGQGTSWCTASTESDYYYDYYKDNYGGNYYININKHDPEEKYQFHFETNQFMDKNDRRIYLGGYNGFLTSQEEGLREFYENSVIPDAVRNKYAIHRVDDIFKESIDKTEIAAAVSNQVNLARDALPEDFVECCLYYDPYAEALDWDYFGDLSLDDSTELISEMPDQYKNEIYKTYIERHNTEDVTHFETLDEQDKIEYIIRHDSEIKDAISTAYNSACQVGTFIEAQKDIVKGIKSTLPRFVEESDLVNGGVSCTFKCSLKKLCEDYLDVVDDLDGMESIEEIILYYIEQGRIYEPQYGWNGFDENTFKNILSDQLSEINSNENTQNESLNKSRGQIMETKNNKQNNKKVLFIIKDKHGNQLSSPNEDDNELWDRVAAMEARGKRGLSVVAFTEDFSDSKTCEKCGTKLNDMGTCPKCDEGDEDITRKDLNESVNWDYYDKFQKIIDEYMPPRGEGETKASQIVTAVNKLIYKWYNDGDVYDNTGHLEGWANDLTSYANWLYEEVPESAEILEGVYDCLDDSSYEDLLKALADKLLDEELLKGYKDTKKVGSIYDHEGPFEFEFYSEEDDEEDSDEDGEEDIDESLKEKKKFSDNRKNFSDEQGKNTFKFKIIYDKDKPGKKEEIIEVTKYEEAEKYATTHSLGWGFDIIPWVDTVKESLKESTGIRGFFSNADGKEFHKDFEDSDALMDFVRKAKELGTAFSGATSIPDTLDEAMDRTIVSCPDMTLQEMKDYCEVYNCEVYNTGVKGKYKLEGPDAQRVYQELQDDGILQESVKENKKDLKESLSRKETDVLAKAVLDAESEDDLEKTILEIQHYDNKLAQQLRQIMKEEGSVQYKAKKISTILSQFNDSIKEGFSDAFTIMWVYMDEDGEPYTGTTIVIGTKDVEKAKEAVKKEHPKVTSFVNIKKGNLGGEWADTIFVHDSVTEGAPVKQKYHITDIAWDFSDEDLDGIDNWNDVFDLPEEFDITVTISDDDDVVDTLNDAIADEYGFLNRGFNFIPVNESLTEGPHKYYICRYDNIRGWDPAEGGTNYLAGTEVTKKWGPFTKEECSKKLADMAEEAKNDEDLKITFENDILVIEDTYEDEFRVYRIERDDRWGNYERTGGGWDWSPERSPRKHSRKNAKTVRELKKKYPEGKYRIIFYGSDGFRLGNTTVPALNEIIDRIDVDEDAAIVRAYLSDRNVKESVSETDFDVNFDRITDYLKHHPYSSDIDPEIVKKEICANLFDATYDTVDIEIAYAIHSAVENYFDSLDESLKEDTIKQGKYWVNKGKEGTHGKFKTKKAADAQRKAMFAQGFKESVEDTSEESVEDKSCIKEGLDDPSSEGRESEDQLKTLIKKGRVSKDELLTYFLEKTSTDVVDDAYSYFNEIDELEAPWEVDDKASDTVEDDLTEEDLKKYSPNEWAVKGEDKTELAMEDPGELDFSNLEDDPAVDVSDVRSKETFDKTKLQEMGPIATLAAGVVAKEIVDKVKDKILPEDVSTDPNKIDDTVNGSEDDDLDASTVNNI